MSFSSIPSFRSGTASPTKATTTTQTQLQLQATSTLSPSLLSNSNRSASLSPSSGNSNFIPWTTNQGKLYKSIGDEAWKKCEKIVI